MPNIKVSIVMSTYNDAKYIEQAVQSVLEQTFQDWEFIITNDASTDNTKTILEQYKDDRRIVVMTNEVNMDLMSNINAGLKISKGDYIARLDSDDFWLPEKLEKQVEFLEKNLDYGLCGTWVRRVDSKGELVSEIRYPVEDSDLRKQILSRNPFISSSVIFRRELLTKTGYYDESKKYVEDYDMWLKLGIHSKVHNLAEILTVYRVNPSGSTENNFKKQMKSSFNLVSEYKNNYPFSSLVYLKWYLRRFYSNSLREMLFRNIIGG